MRSRYTAHVVGKIDYLMQTWIPEIRAQVDPKGVADWARQSQWLGLRVIKHSQQGHRGQVEFIAHYRDDQGIEHHHHELSDFVRSDEEGELRWYFVDGVTPEKMTKTGRNDPCPCGSGKKFKKCCGC